MAQNLTKNRYALYFSEDVAFGVICSSSKNSLWIIKSLHGIHDALYLCWNEGL
jgi:hypothetical protein